MPDKRFTSQAQIDAMKEAIARAKERQGAKKAGSYTAKFFSWTLFSLLVAVLVFLLVNIQIAKKKGETPSLAGYYLLQVTSGSMEPTFSVGTVILARAPKDPAALQEGNIVTFRLPSGALVTHRIIGVFNQDGRISYRTKGDNPQNAPDTDPLYPENVVATFILKVPLT